MAHIERLNITYDLFKEYVSGLSFLIKGNLSIKRNYLSKMERKKVVKIIPECILKEYFSQYGSLCRDIHEKCYEKFVPTTRIKSVHEDNFMLNGKLELTEGFEHLMDAKRNLGNCFNRVKERSENHIVKEIQKIFINRKCSNLEGA